eukprot:438593-Rhodomonas_salina.1
MEGCMARGRGGCGRWRRGWTPGSTPPAAPPAPLSGPRCLFACEAPPRSSEAPPPKTRVGGLWSRGGGGGMIESEYTAAARRRSLLSLVACCVGARVACGCGCRPAWPPSTSTSRAGALQAGCASATQNPVGETHKG